MSNTAILDLPPLRDVIRDAGLNASKALGQNFLLDLNLTASIARLGGNLSDMDVIEIGPGPGGLTRALLLADARSVHAIEYDPRAIEALTPLIDVSGGRLHVHAADALNIDLLNFGKNRAVIANLPYNVATPLLLKLLADIHARGNEAAQFMLLMFQKEVADRITAAPDSKTYGRLSVMTQWLCQVKTLKTLPPSAFTPAPKVKSAIVRFDPLQRQDNVAFTTMERLLAQAFNQRRKMLRSALAEFLPQLEKARIDPTLRAEDVSVEAYVRLARIVEGA